MAQNTFQQEMGLEYDIVQLVFRSKCKSGNNFLCLQGKHKYILLVEMISYFHSKLKLLFFACLAGLPRRQKQILIGVFLDGGQNVCDMGMAK